MPLEDLLAHLHKLWWFQPAHSFAELPSHKLALAKYFALVRSTVPNRARSEKGTGLGALIKVFQRCTSTNPVDKVYGLLGLLKDPISVALRIDVRRNKTPQQVFWDVLECHDLFKFHLLDASKMFAPMYIVPDTYIESLGTYVLHLGTSGSHRKQAEEVIHNTRALSALMGGFYLMDGSDWNNDRLGWHDSLLRDCEVSFSLAWDISVYRWKKSSPAIDRDSLPDDNYGWQQQHEMIPEERLGRRGQGFLHLIRPYPQYSPSPLESCFPNLSTAYSGIVFHLALSRLRVVPLNGEQ